MACEIHYETSSLLVVVKSHLFPQFVHLNRERGKVTAVTSSGYWGDRRVCGYGHACGREAVQWQSIVVPEGGHSGERRGGDSHSQWAIPVNDHIHP